MTKSVTFAPNSKKTDGHGSKHYMAYVRIAEFIAERLTFCVLRKAIDTLVPPLPVLGPIPVGKSYRKRRDNSDSDSSGDDNSDSDSSGDDSGPEDLFPLFD